LCGYFSTTEDDHEAQQEFVLGFMMTKYGSYMTNSAFQSGFTPALMGIDGEGGCENIPAWFLQMFGSPDCPFCK